MPDVYMYAESARSEQGIQEPNVIVFITDGYTDWDFTTKPKVPVIIANSDNQLTKHGPAFIQNIHAEYPVREWAHIVPITDEGVV